MHQPTSTPTTEHPDGFTLIELMVVVLILGILMGIAIPTFLGTRSSAAARAAQTSLRNAVTAEQSWFTSNNQTYAAATALRTTESGLTFVDGTAGQPPSSGTQTVTVYPPDNSTPGSATVLLGTQGGDGRAYFIYEQAGVPSYESVAAGGANTTLPTGPASATSSGGQWANQW